LEVGHRNAIILTWDGQAAADRFWDLGPFPAGDGLGAMAGWTSASEDGGVPPVVARTFARAMTRHGRVTFPCSTIQPPAGHTRDVEAGWQQVRAGGDDHAWFTQEAGKTGGSGRALLRKNVVPLVSTLQETIVAELLFEDPYFQWWNASQFALVSRPPEKPPVQPWRFAVGLLEEGWAGVAAAAAAEGAADVVMRSGVDGDVCGLAFANGEVRRAFEVLLEAAAAENGIGVRTMSYREFQQSLSDALPEGPGA